MATPEDAPARRRLRGREWALIAAIGALVIALVATVLLWPRAASDEAVPTPAPTPTRTQTPSPTPSPTPADFPENTTEYDASALPQIDVLTVNPNLPVDLDPEGGFVGLTAHAAQPSIPVWADPLGEPVASLPQQFHFDGTTVAVIEKQTYWVKVLLAGRQSVPSAGDPRQLTGWLRVADVGLSEVDVVVEVSLSARTIEIVRGEERELIASDFAWGTAETPTPIGRTSIMMIRSVPEFGYTRGHPLIYLSVQSPTLDGFAGGDTAVTAFHYHDERSGEISNGCIRVDETVTARLAELPLGTGVIIRP